MLVSVVLRHILVPLLLFILSIFIFNEFLVYYLKVYSFCEWPEGYDDGDLKVFMIADTHLLGVFRGHWLDKLRREWQMYRSYQSSVSLLDPDAVFFLGDLFDEGQWGDENHLEGYARRFEELFGMAGKKDSRPRIEILLGNHDLGFHYAINPNRVEWFTKRFSREVVDVTVIRDRAFVLLTSMALHGDGCRLCHEAEEAIKEVATKIRCAQNRSSRCGKVDVGELAGLRFQPIVLQHFPLFRKDESECLDVSPSDPERMTEYRPQWEALSNQSTLFLLETLKPSAVFNGHSHRPCTKRWPSFVEYTVNSFSWRNGPDPSLLLVSFPKDKTMPLVAKCEMPNENFVLATYLLCAIGCFVFAVTRFARFNGKSDGKKVM